MLGIVFLGLLGQVAVKGVEVIQAPSTIARELPVLATRLNTVESEAKRNSEHRIDPDKHMALSTNIETFVTRKEWDKDVEEVHYQLRDIQATLGEILLRLPQNK